MDVVTFDFEHGIYEEGRLGNVTDDDHKRVDEQGPADEMEPGRMELDWKSGRIEEIVEATGIEKGVLQG